MGAVAFFDTGTVADAIATVEVCEDWRWRRLWFFRSCDGRG